MRICWLQTDTVFDLSVQDGVPLLGDVLLSFALSLRLLQPCLMHRIRHNSIGKTYYESICEMSVV